MEYWIPASITMDGHEVPGGIELSPTDKQWISRWYPAPPTPQNAVGLLQPATTATRSTFWWNTVSSEQPRWSSILLQHPV